MTLTELETFFREQHVLNDGVVLHEGDNRVSLAALAENSIDAVVTDPPYSLTSITKRFGAADAAPARGGDGSFARVSGGFMGKAWDASGIERDPEFWAAVWRVLKPGGFVFAFAGSRTGHWQACAMEQAGFIMHPMHAWIYGQGFPKGHDLAMAIDKTQRGVHGKSDPLSPNSGKFKGGCSIDNPRGQGFGAGPGAFMAEAGTTVDARKENYGPESQAWDGWKYGTQTQKPAMEPIYLGQKPYDGKPVESILKWGVGAFNIDGCRVPGGKNVPASVSRGTRGTSLSGSEDGSLRRETGLEAGHNPDIGRYPANVLHDGSDAVVALFPESAGQLAKESSSSSARKDQNVYGAMVRGSAGREPRGDSGSAARFFNSFDDYPTAFYHSKAGKEDRAAHLVDKEAGEKPHPTVKPVGLLRHLIRHICPPGGTVLDPFAGTGTTAVAAQLEGTHCVLMEAEPEYVAFLRRRFAVSALPSIFD